MPFSRCSRVLLAGLIVLQLKLFGTASIVGPAGPVPGRAGQGRRLALLALLAQSRRNPLSRDKLIAWIWPESSTDRARAQLSDAVYLIRSALGEDVIRSNGDELALNPAVITSDTEMFEQLLEAGDFEAAAGLYSGPLLDGFHLSAAVEFERWLDAERTRLAQRYAAGLESLADSCEGRSEWTAAVAWWRRVAAHDPYSGRVAVRLMRALEAAGDRAGALQHARIHTTLLQEEFDAAPDPEVTAFAERLRVEPPARTVPQPAPRRSGPGPPPESYESVPDRSPAVPSIRRTFAAGRVYAALAIIAVLAIIGTYRIRGEPRTPPVSSVGTARSVAVLPFVNMSADAENTYFSDGLSEQIITVLSRIDGLHVAARTSSFALRDRSYTVRAIGDTLGVAAVLEGSVRKDGPRLRITAQLIDVATGYHIWADEYNRELQDIFVVQDEIAHAIAGALELRLARSSETNQRMPDLEAYDLYLRGLYLRNSLSADALNQAAEYFDRAIERQPDFALAWAAKASVIAPLMYFGHVPVAQGVPELRGFVTRALALDPKLGEAHAAFGMLKLFFEWDWSEAERGLRHAIELNPNDPHAWHHLANFLRAIGQCEAAIRARERSVALDPLNARTRYTLGTDYDCVGDHTNAMAQFRRAVQLDPVNPLALGLGPTVPAGPSRSHFLQGRYDEAVEEFIKVAVLRNASAAEIRRLRTGYAEDGPPGFWRAWLEMDLRQSGSNPNTLRIATIHALVGDTARTFDWLDRAFTERNPGIIFLRSEPAFESLRTHPRFMRIVNELKFPAP